MCRSIQTLRGWDPSAADNGAVDAVVDEVAAATQRLLVSLARAGRA
jgi:hypothetical protein